MIKEIVTASWKKEGGKYVTSWEDLDAHIRPKNMTGHSINTIKCPYCRELVYEYTWKGDFKRIWYAYEITCPACNNKMIAKITKPYSVYWSKINEYGKFKYSHTKWYATFEEAIAAAKAKFDKNIIEATVMKDFGIPIKKYDAQLGSFMIAKRKHNEDIKIFKRA